MNHRRLYLGSLRLCSLLSGDRLCVRGGQVLATGCWEGQAAGREKGSVPPIYTKGASLYYFEDSLWPMNWGVNTQERIPQKSFRRSSFDRSAESLQVHKNFRCRPYAAFLQNATLPHTHTRGCTPGWYAVPRWGTHLNRRRPYPARLRQPQ